jgi:PAS domain S-box-containing protein
VDIRTKLVFALVAVALSSLFVFGVVIEPIVEKRLRESTLTRLDQLADSKQETLLWVVEGWRDRTRLVASRTQLRTSLAGYQGQALIADRIRTILDDALKSSETIVLLDVRTPDGTSVARVGRGSSGNAPGEDSEPPPERMAIPAEASASSTSPSVPPGGRIVYEGVSIAAGGEPQVRFVASLEMDGERVGTLLAVYDARELTELTSNYEGLGDSGEVLVVAPGTDGSPRTLHPTRHAEGGGVDTRLPADSAALGVLALDGEAGPFADGVVDYRTEPVWAATRFVEDTGWGLVVKVDRDEQLAPSREFRATLRRTALILSAFAILAGFVLGLRFAIPITELAAVAERIGAGDLSARAPEGRHDEVGLLARTFNEMASELEERMELLVEFRRFFDVSMDLLCMAGTDGYFKRVNPAFHRELGWSEEELLGRPFFDFVHPDDIEATQQEVTALASGRPTVSFVNRYLCKDGSYKRLRWATYPDPVTGVLYAVAHVMDDA